MGHTLQAVEAAALQLSADDRTALIERLIDSVLPAPDLHPAWDAELARRIADLDAGRTQFVAADAVTAELRALIAAHDQPT
jgi:putative addiction module component (TIGR02574 family)